LRSIFYSRNGTYSDEILTITRESSLQEEFSERRASKNVKIRISTTQQLVYEWDEWTESANGDFSTSHDVKAYIPGEWEIHFESLYQKALHIQQAKHYQFEQSEKQRLRDNFGL